MAEITNEKRVLISPDRATLADYVANRFLRRIEKQADDPAVHVSLTGGTMGIAVLEAAATHEREYEARGLGAAAVAEQRE